ncbi:MAG: c-type cytochrome, partial [Chloroflexi bacterium]|nr:c-type cytochrome [Chloroflexota bacterium]
VATGFGLTLAVLAVFQVYFWREPGRIQAVEAADLRRAQTAGSELYAENCAACHGEGGEGNLGPVLNSRTLLKATADDTLFSLIRTGVPGTVMPAWGQTYGGPFTDQQAVQLVAFIRAWEATAPEIAPVVIEPDPVRGATIFAETCFICHGENGQGTDRAPMLNDPATLRDFDNAWYRKTIANGRPAKGMPTWGTVLSPQQIDDLVALISAWREGQAVMPLISMRRHLRSALFAVQQYDQPDASFHLEAALAQASASEATGVRAMMDLLEQKDWAGAQARLLTFLPPEEIGQELFVINCAACHGVEGRGGLGKNLRDNKFIQSHSDDELSAFILAGRKGTAMDGFDGILAPEDLSYIITLIRVWQK